MPNQNEILTKLGQLDDAALRDMVSSVAAALGISGFRAKMLTANPDMVRRKLERATPDEFGQLLSSLDEVTLASLLARLNTDTP